MGSGDDFMEFNRMSALNIPLRTASRLGRSVTAIGWGAFKIGRNQGAKYPNAYELPSEADSVALVREVIALGVHAIDTAPAYGLSAVRVGLALAGLDPAVRRKIFLSTKAGEQFADGISQYDFSRSAIFNSVHESLARLQSESVDLVWIHSDGSDLAILRGGGAMTALESLKSTGKIRAIGFSPKSPDGAAAALLDPRVDALMLEFHPKAQEMEPILASAQKCGKAVFVKKPLASGTLDPAVAIPWILAHSAVTCVVVGGLSIERLRMNASLAV